MKEDSSWIKIYRKMLDWEWYSDTNAKVLFLHLLLKVNHKDKRWRGIEVKRGSLITSISRLALETSLSVKMVRVALDKLKSTGEVAKSSTSTYTVVTVLKYDEFQKRGKPMANEGQTKGKPRASTKECKNVRSKELKKYIKKENNSLGNEIQVVEKLPEVGDGLMREIVSHFNRKLAVTKPLDIDSMPSIKVMLKKKQADYRLVPKVFAERVFVAIDNVSEDKYWSEQVDLWGLMSQLDRFYLLDNKKVIKKGGIKQL